jgi:hypothetical protein
MAGIEIFVGLRTRQFHAAAIDGEYGPAGDAKGTGQIHAHLLTEYGHQGSRQQAGPPPEQFGEGLKAARGFLLCGRSWIAEKSAGESKRVKNCRNADACDFDRSTDPWS